MTERAKRSAQCLEDLARLCARLHFEQHISAPEINDRLKGKYDIRGVRDVRMLIARAIELPLVRVRVEEVHAPPTIDTGLGDRLARAAGIRKALVVTSSLANDDSWASPDTAARKEAYRAADALHFQLSHVAAEYLLDTVRPGDAIGVGPGRGVGFTALAFRRRLAERNQNIRDLQVFSLAGAMWVQAWDQRGVTGDYLDADENALEFTRVEPGIVANVKLVQLPLFIEGEDEERAASVRTVAPHLQCEDWRAELGPDRASLDFSIFGVGVLNAKGTHYVMTHPGPHAGAVREVDILRREIVPKCPGAIVDIGDRFWFRKERARKDLRERADEVVRALNRKMVSVSFEKLGAAAQRMVVAGGHQKYDGILAVLTEGQRLGVQPTVLVTDAATAHRLLCDLPTPLGLTPVEAGQTSPWLSQVSSLASQGSTACDEPTEKGA